jgi:CMP-2-keto-3-deoxyoctulosonic acid synthetase
LGEWLKFSPSSNEVTEKLEQLRLIDNAVNISTYKVTGSPKTFLAVDTVADLELAREMTES